jgi:2',3'-cyclic-nucleotide 2'-phosphodiesterase (5'-nucleotidase family)
MRLPRRIARRQGFSRTGAVAAVALAAALTLAAAVAAGRFGFITPAPSAGNSVTLSIVGTNDLHGGVLPDDGRGGLALLGGYLTNLRAARAQDGGAVLLIDAGDMWQGTLESNLTEGASVVEAYNTLDYAAAAVGNHEFDFGPVGPAATPLQPSDDPRGVLKVRAAEARFPLLAANVIDTATNQPVAWKNIQPSIAIQSAGITVGIVGVVTAEALSQTIAANTTGLRIAPLAERIVVEARRLRDGGASVVIVTAHAGGQCTQFGRPTDLSSCDLSSEIVNVARQLPRGLVDLILAGHVHEGMAHEVNGIAVASAYSGGVAFSRVDVAVDRATGNIVSRRIFAPQSLCERANPDTGSCAQDDPQRSAVTSTYEGAPVMSDARITAVLAPAVEKAAVLKASALGVVLETPITRASNPDSPLGNLFVDALRDSVPGADAAIYNVRGGIRADLPAGPLTYGGVFSMIPFDNRIATLRLTGAELERVVAGQLQADPPRMGVSGLRVAARCANGAVAVSLRRPSGRSVADDERLVVVTTDFVAFGGNEILTAVMPAGGFPVPADAPIARDLIADWFRKRGGTLRADQFVDESNPRWTYPGTLPVRCSR